MFKLCRNPKDDAFPKDLKQDDMLFVFDYVSIVSGLTYWCFNWVVSLGYKRPLEVEDLGLLPKEHQVRTNYLKLSKAYAEEEVSLVYTYTYTMGNSRVGSVCKLRLV